MQLQMKRFLIKAADNGLDLKDVCKKAPGNVAGYHNSGSGSPSTHRKSVCSHAVTDTEQAAD